MRSAARLYRVQLALAGLGLGILALIFALASSAISLGPTSLSTVWEACQRIFPSLGAVGWLEVALSSVALAGLGLGLHSAARQIADTRRYLRSMTLTGRSVDIEGTTCLVIARSDVHAFCAGLLHPRVYLSRGAVGALSSAELRAVVAHERHHCRRRDPLRLLAVRALADALFFLPTLKRMTVRYTNLMELAADEAAVEALGERSALARALLRFGGAASQGLAVARIAPERVDHLEGDSAATDWRLSRASLALSAVLAAAIMLGYLVVLLAGPAPLELPMLLAESCMLVIAGAVLLGGGTLWRRCQDPLVGSWHEASGDRAGYAARSRPRARTSH